MARAIPWFGMGRPKGRHRRLGIGASLLPLGVGLLVASPIAYLFYLGATVGLEAMGRLWIIYLLPTLGRTLLLAVLVAILAMTLGLPLAWLVVRTDMPGRKVFRWMGALSLAIPPYIGALSYIVLLGPSGMVNRAYWWLTGQTMEAGPLVDIYGLWGSVFILGLTAYPYVLLVAGSALEATNITLEEAARCLGLSPLRLFLGLTLPLLRPHLLASGLIAFLHALADFGVTSILQVRTLSVEVYHWLITRLDYSGSAAMANLLVLVVLLAFLAQGKLMGRASYAQIAAGSFRPKLISLGFWRWPALAFSILVIGASFFLPLGLLVFELGHIKALPLALKEEWPFALNSLWTAALAATLAVGLALGIGQLVRYGSAIGAFTARIVHIGYAIPGTVLGLSLILLYHKYLPWVYGTAIIVVAAYLIKYLLQATQSVTSSLAQVPRSLEEVAMTLGTGWFERLRRILFHLVRPGLASGWALVFMLSMRELAATLIVRPPGFDTLPVRIWIYTVEGNHALAAADALVLITIASVPLLLLGLQDIRYTSQ